MKTSGGLNFFHFLPWAQKHLTDAQLQLLQRPGREAKTLRRKIVAMYRRAGKGRTNRRSLSPKDKIELNIDPNKSKFPIGLGVVFAKLIPEGPQLKGPPLPGYWRCFGSGDLKLFEPWQNALGRWHAGYRTNQKGAAGAMKPEFFPDGKNNRSDMRFFEATLTIPKWDSAALSQSCSKREVSTGEFNDFLTRVLHRLASGDFERRASCDATPSLRLVALAIHPEDGVLHFHPLFLKAELLAFEKLDGRLLPPDLAPKGGRRKPGEGWIGGGRLGLVGGNGKLVTNPLGPAECAADAMREAGIPAPTEHGSDWGWLDHIIAARSAGSRKEGEGAVNRARGRGLGEPFDLFGSRMVREEVRKLAQRNPYFGARREKEIAAAVSAQDAVNRNLIHIVAGRQIAAITAEKDAAIERENEERKRRQETDAARAREKAELDRLRKNEKLKTSAVEETRQRMEIKAAATFNMLSPNVLQEAALAVRRIGERCPRDGDEQYVRAEFIGAVLSIMNVPAKSDKDAYAQYVAREFIDCYNAWVQINAERDRSNPDYDRDHGYE